MMHRLPRACGSVLILSAAALWGTAGMGCITKPQSSTTSTGTLSTPLRGTGPDGVVYRLRNAVFSIDGYGVATLDSEDHLDQSSASIALEAGGYSITLVDGWSLEREAHGVFEPAPATLVSSRLQVFTIVTNQRTSINYLFAADDHLLLFGNGNEGVVTDADQASSIALCHPTAPFLAIRSVPGLPASRKLEAARFSPDERVVYLAVSDGDNRDLYVAERPDRAAAFNEPHPLAMLNTGSTEAWPSVSSDGLSLFFESNRNGSNRIYVAARATTRDDFCSPALVEDNHSVFSDGQPFVLGNREALFFSSDRTLHWELYRASGNGTVHFQSDTLIGIGSPSDEVAPVPTSDDLAVYFSSTRPDGGARGGHDIWVARRAHPSEPYGSPLNVMELNTDADDFANWASPDGCRLYFRRTDPLGSEIFVAEKTP